MTRAMPKSVTFTLDVRIYQYDKKVVDILKPYGFTGTFTQTDGTTDITDAKGFFGGPGQCKNGCIGFGDCIEACPYDAIHICDGVARINPDKCKACKMCIKTCPRQLIDLFPLDTMKAAVLCKKREHMVKKSNACLDIIFSLSI